MEDRTIIQMSGLAWELLRKPVLPDSANNVIPSYNALLKAAKENHPDNEYISSLSPIEPPVNTTELAVIFSQLKIVIEAEIAVTKEAT